MAKKKKTQKYFRFMGKRAYAHCLEDECEAILQSLFGSKNLDRPSTTVVETVRAVGPTLINECSTAKTGAKEIVGLLAAIAHFGIITDRKNLIDRKNMKGPRRMAAVLWYLDRLRDAGITDQELDELLPVIPKDLSITTDMDNVYDMRHSRDIVIRMLMVMYDFDGQCGSYFKAILERLGADIQQQLTDAFYSELVDVFKTLLAFYEPLPARETVQPTIHPIMAPIQTFRGLEIPVRINDYGSVVRENAIPALCCLTTMSMHAIVITDDLDLEPLYEMYEELVDPTAKQKIAKAVKSWNNTLEIDPYLLCAAQYMLYEQGDLLAMLWGLSDAVVHKAESRLPFGFAREFTPALPAYERAETKYDMIRKMNVTDLYQAKREAFEKVAKVDPAIPVLSADNDDEEYADTEMLSHMSSDEQLIFTLTGILPPRDVAPSKEIIQWLKTQAGMSDERAKSIAELVMWLYRSGCVDYLSERQLLPSPEPQLASDTQNKTDADKIAQLEKALEAEQEKNRQLRNKLDTTAALLTESKQELRERRAENKENKTQIQGLNKEVESLQTIIAEMSSPSEQQEDTSKDINFPFHTRKRIMVCGGHDTFIKTFTHLLPDVSVYQDVGSSCIESIRYQDAVWLQVNAMGHGDYYAIMQETSKRKIPVHYLEHASAKKCAIQILETMGELENREEEPVV